MPRRLARVLHPKRALSLARDVKLYSAADNQRAQGRRAMLIGSPVNSALTCTRYSFAALPYLPLPQLGVVQAVTSWM